MSKLTVDEYAKLKGISKQAVYKKLPKLNTTEEKRNGKTITIIIVDDEELAEFQEKDIQPNSTALNSTVEKVENVENKPLFSNSTATYSTEEKQPNSTVELNQDLIELLKNQLNEKDKQIERLQIANEEKEKQLKEQFDKLTELLYRSQQLEAQIQLLLPDGAKAGEPAAEQNNNNVIEVNTQEQESQEKKKKGFFKRLFSKKDWFFYYFVLLFN